MFALVVVVGLRAAAATRPEVGASLRSRVLGLTKLNVAANRSAMHGDLSCLKNTGGSCLLQECHAWRGATSCINGRCVCSKGCAGPDGTCHERHKTAAPVIKLRNVRWPDQYMYVSNYGSSLYVDHMVPLNDQYDFRLQPLPPYKDDRYSNFLLVSARFNDYVVTTESVEHCSGEKENLRCSRDIESELRHATSPWEAAVPAVTLRFFAAPGFGNEAVMIESFSHVGHFLYLTHFTWQVETFRGDPGTGGYWRLEPGTDVKFPPYTGPRCGFDCGLAGAAAAPSWTLVLLAAAGGFLFRAER